MNEPVIDFKNVKTFRGMEGYGINADVYINGVKCYFIYDSGDGGDLGIDENIKGKPEQVCKNINLLKEYVKQLPERKFEFGESEKSFKVTLEDYLNDKIAEWSEAKAKKAFQNKMAKKFVNCIVIGEPNSGSYQFMTYPKNLNTYPKAWLDNQIKNIKDKYCKNGVIILNNNIEHENL